MCQEEGSWMSEGSDQQAPLPQPPGDNASLVAWTEFATQVADRLRQAEVRTDAARMAFVSACASALQRMPHHIVTPERIEALQTIAHMRYVAGDAMGGVEPAVEALALARQHQDSLVTARSLNVLAYTLGDTVDIAGAIEFYREALDLALALRNERAECAIWINLGGSLGYAAQYVDSIRCFERALRLCDAHPALAALRRSALTAIALAALHLGDVTRGLRAAKQAVDEPELAHDANALLNRSLAETYYARLLLEVAQNDMAKAHSAMAKTYAERSGSARAMLSASIAEGLVEVACGKADIGISRLMLLLEQARVVRTAYRDALYALIAAYKTLGDASKGEVYVRELMLQTRSTQREYLHGHARALLQEAVRPEPPAPAIAEATTPLAEEQSPAWQRLVRLAEAAALRIDPTGEHPYRVGRLAALIAEAHGSAPQECRAIELAGRVHDVGLGALPQNAFGELADSATVERTRLRRHSEIGAELLGHVDLELARFAHDIVLHHHEHYDGSGFPAGIIGTAIPFPARVVGVANAFDTLTHAGPNRSRKSIDQALDELVRHQRTKYDPHVVQLCVEVVTRLREQVPDLDDYLAQPADRSPLVAARRSIQTLLATPIETAGR